MYTSSSNAPYRRNDKEKTNVQSSAKGLINTINRTASKVADGIDTGKEKVSQATDMTRRQIRNNPVRSSIIALGIGFLLANLIR